jgi:hypothetical protein
MVHAPGIIAWAINGYAFPRDRKNIRNVIVAGWQIPEDAAKALLLKKVPYEIDGETVVFTCPPEQAS